MNKICLNTFAFSVSKQGLYFPYGQIVLRKYQIKKTSIVSITRNTTDPSRGLRYPQKPLRLHWQVRRRALVSHVQRRPIGELVASQVTHRFGDRPAELVEIRAGIRYLLGSVDHVHGALQRTATSTQRTRS